MNRAMAVLRPLRALGALSLLLVSGPNATAQEVAPVAELPTPTAEAAGGFQGDEPRVRTRLLGEVRDGRARVGVVFEVEPGWHIYWKNPGQTGLATEVEFSADGAEFGELQWPAPTVFVESSGFIVSYGYEERVLLQSELVGPPPDSVEARTDFLVCGPSTCIRGRTHLRAPLQPVDDTAATGAAAPDAAALFDEFARRAPTDAASHGWQLTASVTPDELAPGDAFEMRLRVSSSQQAGRITMPEPARAFAPERLAQVSFEPVSVERSSDGTEVELLVRGRLGVDPVELPQLASGVLFILTERGQVPIRFQAPIPRLSPDSRAPRTQ